MELKTGDKLFGLERRLYSFGHQEPYVFVVHAVTPKLAHIQPFSMNDYKPFDGNDYKQSSKYTVYRTLVPKESRFVANWRGRPHPAFSSSFDYLWLWDVVSKQQYLQSVLNLKIKRYLNGLSIQFNSVSLDNFQQGLKTFEMLNQLSETLDGFFKSKDLVFSETELSILQVQTFNQILEDFSDV
ncbi:MAG: hypothetical protein ACOVOQ_04850 [Flavobacterium sp.]|jgi:hypothetical protein